MKGVPLHTTRNTSDVYAMKAQTCLRLAREAREQIRANSHKLHPVILANVVPEYVRLARYHNHVSVQRRREMKSLNAKRLTPPTIPERKRPGGNDAQ